VLPRCPQGKRVRTVGSCGLLSILDDFDILGGWIEPLWPHGLLVGHCPVQIGAVERCPAEGRAVQLGAGKDCPLEVGPVQDCPLEVGAVEACSPEGGAV
jgi:hypothetical protein